MAMLTATVSLAQDTAWWGFWTVQDNRWAQVLEVPDGTHDYAVRLMPTDDILRDGKIHGLRFLLSDRTAVKRAWIWVSARQFSWGGDGPDMAVRELELGELKSCGNEMPGSEGYTEVDFDVPVDVLPSANRRSNCYVGFTLQVEGAAQTPCCIVSTGAEAPGPSTHSCYVDWYDMHSSYGALALQLKVSGANIGQYAAVPGSFEPVIGKAGTSCQIETDVVSQGTEAVSSISYQVTLGGETQPERTCAVEPAIVELGHSARIRFDVDVPAVPQLYDCRIAITKVNGHENERAEEASTNSFYALSQTPLRRTVMEELTGTWCPNCPRGLVGMELMEQQFGDRFIGIAVHGGDTTEPMRLPAYDGSAFIRGVSSRLGGRPSCSVDRTIDCDPYLGLNSGYQFGIDFVVRNLLEVPTVADLTVNGQWTDESRTAIDVDVATTFRFALDSPEAPYQLMLVLTADSLTGEGSDWLQVNTLVGKTEWAGYLDGFVYGERYMALKYCHVPFWADGVENGIEGSIAMPLVADEPQHYRRTVALSSSPLAGVLTPLALQHAHVVALLIDTRTGLVTNAAKGSLGTPSGIAGPALTRPAGNSYYSLDGRRLAGRPAKGIVIVRRNDGRTVKKVVRGTR